jgi:bacterioferritin (cytochrome b1)
MNPLDLSMGSVKKCVTYLNGQLRNELTKEEKIALMKRLFEPLGVIITEKEEKEEKGA